VKELGEGCEARRRPANDREHQREPVPGGADHRLRAAADADLQAALREVGQDGDLVVTAQAALVVTIGRLMSERSIFGPISQISY
jgi:hypothetical protein